MSTDNVTTEPAETSSDHEPRGQHLRPVRVAHLMQDVRPYRVAFYERISQRSDVEVVIYSGYPNPGLGAPTTRPELAVPVVDLDNRFYPRRPRKILWQRGVLGILRSDADVIVCHEVVSNLSVWAIRLLHRPAGKRLVLMGFFYRPEGSGMSSVFRDWLRRLLRRSASALVAYTDQGRDELFLEGVPEDLVFVTRNTLDTDRLIALAEGVGNETSAQVRTRLDIPVDAVVLAFVGRLSREKRVEVAIEAVRIMHKRIDVPVVLVVIGDGEEREALEAQARDAPVRFLGQIYDDRELADLLSVASLMVIPGRVGLTCVLGFANGLPVVTTDSSAIAQTPEFSYVRHDENAVVVEAPRPQLYADAVEDLLSDEDRMNRLKLGALESAKTLSMGRMVDAYAAAVRVQPR